MRIKKPYITAVSCALALTLAAPAIAQSQKHTPPTPEQRKAIHDCAAKQGVELPPPPPEQPPGNMMGVPNDGMPPQGKKDMGHRPMLTDAQKAIVDSCFKAQGLTPPPHHRGPPQGMGGGMQGPGGSPGNAPDAAPSTTPTTK